LHQIPLRHVSLGDSFYSGIKQGFYSFFALIKVMIPVYIFIMILKEIGVVGKLAGFFAPLMVYFGLPGEASLVIATGWTVNLYGAIAVLAGLNFTVRQTTILAVMLGFSHSLLLETAIINQMKGRPWILLALRISVGLISGLILNLVLPVKL
jgi:hypothetical protein